MSFGFRIGSTPVRTNPKWVRWAKILAHYQSLSGADARNDLTATNPVRLIKEKILRSVSGSDSTDIPASITLSAGPGDASLIWTWNKDNPTSWSVQHSDFPDQNWIEVGTPAGGVRVFNSPSLFKYHRVLAVGGSFDGTISNVVFIPS